MRQLEIKKQIEENNKIIESLMTPNMFTLNNTIAGLLAQNKALQDECEHVFEEGYCVYCMKGEED